MKNMVFFSADFKMAADFKLMVRFFEGHLVQSSYLNYTIVTMLVGGASNTFTGILKGRSEIMKSLKKNKLRPLFFYLFQRYLPKLIKIFPKMKILIVGGSGFVGSRLLSEVNTSDFYNLDKNPSLFYKDITLQGDIRHLDQVKIPKGTSSIVLLAAEHRDDISPTKLYYDVNVQGTKNVLQAMDIAGVKNLIFISSVAIFGLNKINPNEKSPKDAFNHYGKSKWQAEQVIKDWYKNDPKDKSVTILRPTVIFGERNRGNVYNLLKQISSGRFIMIGKGDNKKSMAYVGNIVALIKSRLEASEKGYHVFNYADKPDLSMNELTHHIKKKMKINLPKQKIPYWLGMLGGYGFDLMSFISRKKKSISSVRVKKFCATTQFDASKVHKIFNPPYTLQEGLDKTLEHEFINPKQDEVLFFSE
jgi:nucleoside-diphosphate-sugar epimerase